MEAAKRLIEKQFMPSTARLRIIAFTNGRNSPSARFRVRQHIDSLSHWGLDVVERHSMWPGRTGRSFASAMATAGFALGSRACDVVCSYKFSGSLLQRWMLSRFRTLEFAVRKPRVLDVDDAIWEDCGAHATRMLAAGCRGIICGNAFLAERFSEWNTNTAVVPTAIDTTKFRPRDNPMGDGPQIICWSGSSSTLKYLHRIDKPLSVVLQRNPNARLRVICDTPPRFTSVPGSRTEYVPWSEQQEISAIQECTIGVMPLEDNEWARGKCSFKMLCYMACGIPAVVSPVGTNNEVLALGNVGLAATNADDWISALDYLLKNETASAEIGGRGRAAVQQHYSSSVVAPILAGALRRFIEVG